MTNLCNKNDLFNSHFSTAIFLDGSSPSKPHDNQLTSTLEIEQQLRKGSCGEVLVFLNLPFDYLQRWKPAAKTGCQVAGEK